MTNKEIAKYMTDIVFSGERMNNETIALKTFVEFMNNPSQHSSEVGYGRKEMEQSILDLLKDIRLNYVHYMDLSEK